MKIAIYLLVAVLIVTGCKKENKYLPPDFNYKIPSVGITENIRVGAYYNANSSADWAKKYTDTPSLGEYNSLDPKIMSQERTWADQAGIDFFIFNWDGAADADPLLNSFVSGRNNTVKMVLDYNTAHLKLSNSSPLTGPKLATMISEFLDLAENRFDQDYYYTVDGMPVVMISPINLTSSKQGSINYTTAIPALRAALDSIGIKIYLIGEITSGWLPPQRYDTSLQVMNAVVLKDWSTSNYDQASFIPSFSDLSWKHWTDSTSAWGIDYIPCIFPGYNDKVMTPTSKKYNIDRSPEFYTDYCNVAKRNMGNERIVLINSWNNFQIGTDIEPTDQYGTIYLDITRKQFKIN